MSNPRSRVKGSAISLPSSSAAPLTRRVDYRRITGELTGRRQAVQWLLGVVSRLLLIWSLQLSSKRQRCMGPSEMIAGLHKLNPLRFIYFGDESPRD